MSTSINVRQFMLTFLVIWTLTMIASNMGQCPSDKERVTGWGPTQNQG